jgi:hypothetical protein
MNALLHWGKKCQFAYLMTGTSDDGGEDGTRSVISGESSLAHTGSIVNDQSGNFVLHFSCVVVGLKTVNKKRANVRNSDHRD